MVQAREPAGRIYGSNLKGGSGMGQAMLREGLPDWRASAEEKETRLQAHHGNGVPTTMYYFVGKSDPRIPTEAICKAFGVAANDVAVVPHVSDVNPLPCGWHLVVRSAQVRLVAFEHEGQTYPLVAFDTPHGPFNFFKFWRARNEQ